MLPERIWIGQVFYDGSAGTWVKDIEECNKPASAPYIREPEPCVWTHLGYHDWSSECGVTFCVDPRNIGAEYKVCPSCGGRIVDIREDT